MKTATTVCGKCSAEIPADARPGVCPACLLETGLDLLMDEVVAGVDDPGRPASPMPATARRPTMLGDFGDYELLEEIGRGGQGVVYRARQKSLNRTVALKVIGLGQWATEAHLKRFRREAEAAARLEHPSIVPIHEVGERDGSCYFSMKLVEGGQLDEVVRHSPMSTRQAAELIAKVARTVHYAHEHGILHRDIKPGNILLDAKGEPHLTDFGLARLVETESTVTRTKEVLGTPSYMAPEQAAGETGKLTSATDVYELGAVLYQLLTGHPPFAGGTTYETVKLLLETEPRRPRLLNPKVDRDLSAICLKCLEKDPKRRYPSALALAEDLEHWLKHEPIHAKRSGFFTHTRKWVRRHPSTALLVTLLIALAVGLSVTVWNRKARIVIPKSVAVLPFQNLSPDPDNAYFADGIQEEILTRLAGIAELKVISRTSTQRYQSKPRNLSQIAKQLGVANIVEGSVQKAGDQVRVNVQLINAQTDAHLWADTYDRKLTDILLVESEIAKGIAESLQTKLTGREEQALAVKLTNNPEAYDAYLRGLAFEARNYANVYSDDVAAKTSGFYARAVQLDPNFAIAWARLSRAQARTHAITGVGGDASKRALDNAQKLMPNSPETLLALGYHQYRVLRDHDAAESTFGRVSKMLPGNSEVLLALSRVTRGQEHWDASIAYSEQALALDPRNVELLMDTAITYAELRQFPTALKLYDRVLDITPTDTDVLESKATIYFAQGNLPEAAKLLSQISWQTANGQAKGVKVSQLTFERNYGEIIRLLQAENQNEVAQMWLAQTQRLAGDAIGARINAQQARETMEPLYKDQPNDVFFASNLAEVYALLGEKDLALKAAERAIVLASDNALSKHSAREHLARILAMVGENSRAIPILAELLQKPYWSYWYGPPALTPALLRLDPFWDPLRSDPAFQRLCEDKQP
jgi:serine/threonine protein kinase/predicted Zn-dependent protease